MAKFTPGPLTVTPHSTGAAIWYEDGDMAAEVHENLGALPEPINAMKLAQRFAAANEMYEALKLVQCSLSALDTSDMALNVDVALAKADGEVL